MKSIICTALLLAGLCGCEKIDINRLEGTWSEQYDPAVFAMDCAVVVHKSANINSSVKRGEPQIIESQAAQF